MKYRGATGKKTRGTRVNEKVGGDLFRKEKKGNSPHLLGGKRKTVGLSSSQDPPERKGFKPVHPVPLKGKRKERKRPFRIRQLKSGKDHKMDQALNG